MASIVEIPLTPQAQRFTITLGDTPYRMRFMFNTAVQGGWTLDLGAQDGTVLVAGIPLVTGTNLLAQHAHLEFPGALIVATDRDSGEVPTFDGLGTTSHLYFVVP